MTGDAMHGGRTENDRPGESRGWRWASRILTAISVLFLTFDGVTKIMKIEAVTKGMAELGYPDSLARPIGVIVLVCVVLYLVPRTAVLGAILLTGFLGGAVASQLRILKPLLGYTLFPVYVALMLWGGLYLRDDRLRALIPLRSNR